MKKLNPKQTLFVQQVLAHGDKIKAYRYAYPTAKHTSTSRLVYKLMNNPLVAQRLAKETEKIIKKTGLLHTDILKEKLDSLSGMKDILVAIIKGDIKSEKPYIINAELKTIELKASIQEILKTLNLNLKLMQNLAGKELPPILDVFIEEEKGS